MAHYAFLDKNNVVVKVVTGVDETVTQIENGLKIGGSTEMWEQFYASQPWNLGLICKRTSYNATNGYRKNYAGIGYTYDAGRDAFIPPKPYESWVLNEDTCLWGAPVPYPTDGAAYVWDEETVAWTELTDETE
jgi:hypothetical protein